LIFKNSTGCNNNHKNAKAIPLLTLQQPFTVMDQLYTHFSGRDKRLEEMNTAVKTFSFQKGESQNPTVLKTSWVWFCRKGPI
jgi:hypothetical protein